MMADLSVHLPTPHAECSVVSDQKQHEPRVPPSLFPDLTPSDFVLFPRMKNVLKGKRFDNVEDMKQTNKNGRSTIRHQNQ